MAFVSNSTALSTNPNGYNAVYRKDTTTGAVVLVSANTSGAIGNGASGDPAVSSDGRYVAFDSVASDLVAGDINGVEDVFVRDLQAGTTTLVSVPASGGTNTDASYSPSISANGNRIAFESRANLTPDDVNCGKEDVYLRDRAAGTTTRVSKIVGWSPGSANQCGGGSISTFQDAHIGRQGISADGRYVVFTGHWSGGPFHNGPCAYNPPDVYQPYAYDSTTGATPSLGGEWTFAGCDGARPAISADGSTVAFVNRSWNGYYLAAPGGYTPAPSPAYTYGNPPYFVNILPSGQTPNASVSDPVLSSNGARIAFSSAASNLSAGDTNGREDVFYLDWAPTTTAQASLTSSGADPQSFSGSGGSTAPAISADGTAIAFESVASDLVSGDTNNASDVFTRTGLPAPAPPPLTPGMLFGGGFNKAIPCLACQASRHNFGKPVDSATGNFWHTFNDLSVPGRGMPLQFSHTYNSGAASTNGPLGYGWTNPYNISLTNPDGSPISGTPASVVVNQEDASTVTFSLVSGSYIAPPFVQATLAAPNGNVPWTFTRRARETFTFDPSGHLTSERDLNGYTTAVGAVGATQTITEDSRSGGRTLTLTYTSSRVTRVTDTATPPRSVSFAYNDGAGNLTDITDVAGGNWHFTYDTSHRMLTMRDPRGNTTTNHYDASSRVDWQKDELNRQTSFDYTSIPGSTKVTDPNGNITVQAFSGYLLTSETKGYGTPQAATWSYSNNPLTLGVASATDPNGHTRTTTYDLRGNPVTTIDGLSRQSVSTFDSLSDLTSTTDPKGVTTTMTYDGAGNLQTRSTPLDSPPGTQLVTYHYGDGGHPGDVTSVTDPNTKTWSYGYDAYGDLQTITDPLTNKTVNCYDTVGRKTETMTPKGSTGFTCPATPPATPPAYATVYTPNTFGDITSTTDSLNHASTRTYDAGRNLLTNTDPNGKMTSYTYDAANELTTAISPDSAPTSYGYDLAGNQTSVTAAAAPAASDDFNRADGAVGTAPTGQAWQAIYGTPAITGGKFWTSAVNHVQAVVDSGKSDGLIRGTVTMSPIANSSNAYLMLRLVNSNNFLFVYMDQGANTIALWRDLNGAFTNLSGNVTKAFSPGASYDVSANLSGATITAMVNGSQVFTYTLSPADQTTFGAATKHGLGINVWGAGYQGVRWDDFSVSSLASTTYAYDPLNRVSSTTDQLNRTTTFVYDGVGNRLTKQDPGGNCAATPKTGCTSYGYDAADQLASMTYSDGTTPNVSNITYDNDGQRTAMTDGTGTSTWTWDSLHRLTQSKNGAGQVVNYGYDLRGQLTSETYPGNKTVARTYDDAGRPYQVSDWLTHTTTYAPDPNSNLTSATTPVGSQNQVDSWTYDNTDQASSSTVKTGTTTLGSLSYGRDSNAQLTSQAESGTGLPGSVTHTYGYDSRNRLTTLDGTAYGYDQANNPSQQATGLASPLGGGPRQGFDAAGQLCFQSSAGTTGTCASPPVGATTAGYDARGNRTTLSPAGMPGTSLSYDQANRLTRVAATAASGNQGQYTPLTGGRILDTRAASRQGVCPGATCATIPAGGTLKVQVTGQGGVPASGVGAVAVSVAALSVSGSSGYLTLWPYDSAQPGTSNVNWPANQTVSNTAIVKVAGDGTISIYSGGGSSDVIVDTQGWYATSSGGAGSTFNPMTGSRILDTRAASRQGVCPGTTCSTIGPGGTLKVQISGQGGVPSTGVSAVAMNVTATNQTSGTYLTVWPSDQTRPTVSSANVPPAGNKSQLVEAKLAADGTVSIYSNTASVDVIFDVVGWYGSGATSLYQPVNGARLLDTRTPRIGTCPDGCQTLGPNATLTLHVAGRGGVPSTGATAVAVNFTTTNATVGGYLTAWPSDQPQPQTSMSIPSGQDTGNAAIVKLAPDGSIKIYNALGSVDVIVDLQGYYVQAGPTTTYTYDGDGLRATKTSGSTASFIWDVSGGLPKLISDGTLTFVYGPDGSPLEQIDGAGNVTWLHHDQEGTTRLLTTSTGAVAGSATYDPFGNLLFRTGSTSPMGYTGEYTDAESGLIYMRARYYDPATAQWLSRDPALAITLSAYGYADDNPLNHVDPTGLCPWGMGEFCHVVKHDVLPAAHEVGDWATTATELPNSRFFTGTLNAFYGGYKIANGAVLLTVGTAEDLTGLGALLGVPTQAYGIYQLGTGVARIYRGYNQLDDAFSHPTVCKTPLHYGEDIGLDLVPFGGSLENLLGGLP